MEAEQQQGQKTVVAFISGLLIGGLLMWVFSAEPKKDMNKDIKKDDAKEVATGEQPTEAAPTTEAPTEVIAPAAEVTLGAGSIALGAIKAGTKVALGDMKFPAEGGWVAVHQMEGENLSTVLGASRFDTKTGLIPKEVELLASMKQGDTYAVVFHGTDGNRAYSSKTDLVLKNAEGKFLGSTFKAE
jgi:heme-binding NEAT domain protein